VLATLSATRTAALTSAGAATPEALTGGYRLALLVGAGLVLAAVLVALPTVRPERQPAKAPQRELEPALCTD
jgi:hypothetical protein